MMLKMLIDCIIIDGIRRILNIRIIDFRSERQRHSIKLISAESLELINQQIVLLSCIGSM